VAIAYALRPKLLFLDEPTSGVSTRDKGQIMDTIAGVVRREGITAVIIKHDMDVVFKYSNRIVVMFPEVQSLLRRGGLHLSGGQRKMVSIARAMMPSPSLLLLDEAFEGLAPVVVNRFTEAVMKIKAMGISILMAESHLAAALRIGDRLYAIDRGEIIFHGRPQDALADDKVVKALRG
jgi:ABC-type branched-subunit amino acid transport system ATPase component